ncbi:MAG: hypothetical protein J7M18_07770 [Candidatus Eremiobacteraeota bacterium]|nr:hypothetical protein [Candidatus Eremiobacteraeota bacterium]
MRSLKKVVRKKDVAMYEVPESKVRTFIVSTPETRKLINRPEIVGWEFLSNLRAGLERVVRSLPTSIPFSRWKDHRICVFHFLRGGLNFSIQEVLYRALGFKRNTASFMTSQRYRKGKRWSIKLDQYRQVVLPDDSYVFIGDVVATGTTLNNGLTILREKALKTGKNLRALVLFTIGGERAEEILAKHQDDYRKYFDFEDCYVFYIEGCFGLADEKTNLAIKIPGTDLLRYPALLSPEFELSQYERLSSILERCIIYDVGAKSFEPMNFLLEIKSYWEELSSADMTLMEACKERWPEKEYENLKALYSVKEEQWKGIGKNFIRKLYRSYKDRWTPGFIKKAQKTGSLESYCNRRIKEIEKAMNQ